MNTAALLRTLTDRTAKRLAAATRATERAYAKRQCNPTSGAARKAVRAEAAAWEAYNKTNTERGDLRRALRQGGR